MRPPPTQGPKDRPGYTQAAPDGAVGGRLDPFQRRRVLRLVHSALRTRPSGGLVSMAHCPPTARNWLRNFCNRTAGSSRPGGLSDAETERTSVRGMLATAGACTSTFSMRPSWAMTRSSARAPRCSTRWDMATRTCAWNASATSKSTGRGRTACTGSLSRRVT